MPKPGADKVRDHRAKMKADGWVRFETYVPAPLKPFIKALVDAVVKVMEQKDDKS